MAADGLATQGPYSPGTFQPQQHKGQHIDLNSLAPGRFSWRFRWVIFMLILVIDDWCMSCEIAIRWIQLDLTDDKSTLVQVMAWCRQATSHYLSQCWPRSLSPYGAIRPQWVKLRKWTKVITVLGLWKIWVQFLITNFELISIID